MEIPAPPAKPTPPPPLTEAEVFAKAEAENKAGAIKGAIGVLALGAAFMGLGLGAGDNGDLTTELGIFVLAGMVGYQVRAQTTSEH